MSESQLIQAKFIGIPNKKSVYRGDGLECHLSYPKSCDVLVSEAKAAQLLKDFPVEWEFPEIKDRKQFLKSFEQYSNRMIAHAESKKGIKISYTDSRPDEYYPDDAVITISKPKKKAQPKPEKPIAKKKK